jgi:outer membrane protein assembly factor BamB
LASAALGCGVLAPPLASTAELGPFWPQFHGPNRDNVSTETGLLDKWPEEGPELIWTADGIGFGFSSASIADGRIYTAGNLEGQTVVSALDMDGQILWKTPNGKAWSNPFPGTRGTPTVDGGHVYHESAHGDVTCFDAASGKKTWSLNVLGRFESENIRWGLSESLLIDGDRVICCPGGPQTCMVALDKHTGQVVWQAESAGDGAGYASPTLVEHEGLRIILTLTAKAMIGVDAHSGKLLWRTDYTTLHDENVLRPVFHDGRVFVSGLKTGSVQWKVHVDGRSASVEEAWRSDQMDNHHGGVVLVDGFLYGASCTRNDAKWICLDWNTGEMRYAEKGVGKGSLTCADGMLYTLHRGHVVGLVKATPEAHKVVSRFTLPKGGFGPSWAHPVVCGGRLYVRHGEFLYAYDVRAKP